MFTVKKSANNPLLTPNTNDPWEAKAVFNWCPVVDGDTTHYVYRAMSATEFYFGSNISISFVGYTSSVDGVNFTERKQLIFPEYAWEKYGCEDPRVTKIDDTYYIFYTALEKYPYTASGIKVAVAITKDFKTIEEKHVVTPFNAKAMTLFPEKVNDKYVVMFSMNTDNPPAKMCIAEVDKIEDLWSDEYWKSWSLDIDSHTIEPRRAGRDKDYVEVGAVPIKTEKGWLAVYSYIENYFRDNNPFPVVFGVEAMLLNSNNCREIIGRTTGPMFTPSEIYEKQGQINDIVFPSGALINGDNLDIYYGAADSVCCKATVNLNNLLNAMEPGSIHSFIKRYDKNPILAPREGIEWEARGVLNPASIVIDGITHIVYRAMSSDDTSRMGYARTTNGFDIDYRGIEPIYSPRESFESKTRPGNSGCEDPRLTIIDDKVYMCYTAYDGTHVARVAITSISIDDFKNNNWNWSKPIVISPENVTDKDACVVPEKINGKYVIFHRVNADICADYTESLDFPNGPLETATPTLLPVKGMWDSEKIGIAAPPIKTEKGWLLLYHGISLNHHTYRVGAALLAIDNPFDVIARTSHPIFEPETYYEKIGLIPNVVFPCGTTVIGDDLFIYYGGADSVIGVATISIEKLLKSLK